MLSKKNAHLEILGLTVPLGMFQEYHDLGAIKIPLGKFADEQLRSTGKPLTLNELYLRSRQKEKLTTAFGVTIVKVEPVFLGIFQKKKISIVYLDSDNPIIKMYARAEQETSALRELGYLSRLDDLLSQKYGIGFNKPGFRESKKEEQDDFVDSIGGIYGLLERGYLPHQIRDQDCGKINATLSYFVKNTTGYRLSQDGKADQSGSFVPRK
ncbi:MAG TPA: hypothetical protein VJB13_04410 [Candidatus Nanoarchaeia archaeon]|nr:hypothetical protein [Candidatus Nanoarchaeia archaeon]